MRVTVAENFQSWWLSARTLVVWVFIVVHLSQDTVKGHFSQPEADEEDR